MTSSLTHVHTRVRVRTRLRDMRGHRVRRMRLALHLDGQGDFRVGFIMRMYRQTCEVMLLGTHPHHLMPFTRVTTTCIVQIR